MHSQGCPAHGVLLCAGRERLKLIGDLTQQTLSRGQKAAIVMEQLKAHLGGKGAERDVAEDR